jgi:hypothetical protein
LLSGQEEIGKARMRESKESRQNPSRSFWGEEKMKKKKHLQRKVEME